MAANNPFGGGIFFFKKIEEKYQVVDYLVLEDMEITEQLIRLCIATITCGLIPNVGRIPDNIVLGNCFNRGECLEYLGAELTKEEKDFILLFKKTMSKYHKIYKIEMFLKA